MLYNVALFAAVQQSESAICVCVCVFTYPLNRALSPLCYSVGSHLFSVLYIVVCIRQSQSPDSSHRSFPLWYPCFQWANYTGCEIYFNK